MSLKKIILLGVASIDGTDRFPSEGTIEVLPEKAAELIEVGLAKADDLERQKVDEVRATALAEGADIAPDATKSETIAAVRERRGNA